MTKGLMAGIAALTLVAGGAAEARDQEIRRESNADMRGLTLLVGGGVEGYTNALASQIEPGAAYGVTLALKPSKVLGVELGYSGAINEFDTSRVLAASASGPDIVRNGAQAAVTLGLGAAPLQPYVMGGLGLSRYNVRAVAPGFADDTVGNVPVGAGLRLHVGSFTADARVAYNFLFDQEFSAALPPADVDLPGDETFSKGGRYTGTLNLGATW